jgi:hypothetical protein
VATSHKADEGSDSTSHGADVSVMEAGGSSSGRGGGGGGGGGGAGGLRAQLRVGIRSRGGEGSSEGGEMAFGVRADDLVVGREGCVAEGNETLVRCLLQVLHLVQVCRLGMYNMTYIYILLILCMIFIYYIILRSAAWALRGDW